MKPKGGTEIQKEQLVEQLDKHELEGINLITSICHPSLLKQDEINIIWQQLSYDQPNVQLMADRRFVDQIPFFVYNSHWCFNQFREKFKIPEYKSFVIKNAVHPFKDVKPYQKGNKIKLIYTSTPWRGLSILLLALQYLNKQRDDFECDIYSSTSIYGKAFEEQTKDQFEPLFEKCRNTKNVNYQGYATNDEVRQALIQADILAYPSIFEETSCIAVIEAMMARCKVVTTNYGALTETGTDFADMIEFEPNFQMLAQRFAVKLNAVMNQYQKGELEDDLDLQVQYYNKHYSWQTRINEWRNFLAYAKKRSTN